MFTLIIDFFNYINNWILLRILKINDQIQTEI